MRLEIKKFVFIGLERDKSSFFHEAQKLGKIQFKDHDDKISSEIEEALSALKILSGFEADQKEDFAPEIIKKVLHLNEEQEQLKQVLRQLREEIVKVKPFGAFDFELLKEIEKKAQLKARFFYSKDTLDNCFFIDFVGGYHYYFSFQEQPSAIEIKIERPLSLLYENEKILIQKQNEILEALSKYASFKSALKAYIYALKNRHLLFRAMDSTDRPIEKLFTCSGWIPDNQIEKVALLTNRFSIHMEEITPDKNETAPTCLENNSWGKVGEDLVDIFDTPSNTDKDPSYWVLIGFALFFAFIIGDGGYGAVFLGLLLFLRYKNPQLKGIQKRMLNLGMLLSGFCIAWGILTHAFFNISFDFDSPVRKFSLITHLAEMKADYILETKAFQYADWIKEFPAAMTGHEILRKSSRILSLLSDHVLLELSLFIGVIHMLTGMFRYLFRNIQLIGWILFLIGSYLYLPYFLQVPSLIHYAFHIPYEGGAKAGLYLIAFGVPLSIIIAVYKHGATGVFEIMNGIAVFSDALSYLRLYALALAGSIVSATINQASAELPLVFAIMLIGVAHMINMGLGIMGGVIHGLRLNFLEWYHYSFEGGGRKFKPLALID